jgi:hypothetical protein
MAQSTLKSLEQRVAALEKTVAQLVQSEAGPLVFKDWRKAVGKLRGSASMKKIDEAGRRIREADRRKPLT